MSERVYDNMHYELTDDDKDQITKYFNESNLEELIEYCSALAMAASFAAWRYAGLYLKDVGEEKFFRSCGNCGYTFDCEYAFAINECGDRYEKWIPPTEDQEERLEKLKKKVNE